MKTSMISPQSVRRSLSAFLAAAALPVLALAGVPDSRGISGKYLEVRSCDVYTGPCFANAEMGIAGREGMLVWNIERGEWNGVELAGLNVIAVVQTDETLGDQRYQPRQGRAVLITDERATTSQREALVSFAKAMAGSLVADIRSVESAPIEAEIGACGKMGCARVTSPGLVEISTRCLTEKDHICGNEDTYYPPLTEVTHAVPAFSELAAYWGNGRGNGLMGNGRGNGLTVRWEGRGQRNVFLGSFSR